MYEKRYNEKEGWGWVRIGVFGGDSGQNFTDGSFTGSDKARSLISLVVENGISTGSIVW